VSSQGRRIPHEPAIARFVELSELALDELRAALARGTGDGPRTLLGGLSVATVVGSGPWRTGSPARSQRSSS
jgi:hypothetical protein